MLNEDKIRRVVEGKGLIVPTSHDVQTILTGVPGGERFYTETVRDFWLAKTNQFTPEAMGVLLQVVKERRPDFYPTLVNYLNGHTIYCNVCFIMRRDVFDRFSKLLFPILFEIEEKLAPMQYTGELIRQPAFCGEILFGAFIMAQKAENTVIEERQVVHFDSTLQNGKETKTEVSKRRTNLMVSIAHKLKEFAKKLMVSIFPSYRVALRLESQLKRIEDGLGTSGLSGGSSSTVNSVKQDKPKKPVAPVLQKTIWERQTLTSSLDLTMACLAMEIHETHKETFSEFRCCHTGQDVVIVATGPSMKYYTQLPSKPHIGVNAAYKRPDIKLDYYFMTDYEACGKFLDDLKDYDFIKFFGQYSVGNYRDRFQVPEHFLMENHGRRFFTAAPNEDIPVNIEFYPLMGFYSISFSAIHFALYTNAKRIYLVGCDCTMEGYFDGSKNYGDLPKWARGYKKLNAFVQRFYPETEIISINPVGLKGLFHDVYTESYLKDHPEIDWSECEILQ